VVCAALTVLLVGCQGKRMKPPTIEWQPATHELAPLMPNGIQMNGTAVLTVDGRQYLYILGGNRTTDHGGDSRLIHYAPITGTDVGPWAVADARLERGGTSYHTRSAVAAGGRIYLVGGRFNQEGDFSTTYNGVRVFEPDATGNIPADSVTYYTGLGDDGGIRAVEPALDLLEMSAVGTPSRRHPGEHVVYVIGGGLGETATTAVRSFRVAADGSIVDAGPGGELRPALRVERPLPEPVAFAPAVIRARHLYLIGGNPPSDRVYFARLRDDDSVGVWQLATARLPIPLFDSAAAVLDGRLYVIGGTSSSNAEITNQVWRAVINPAACDIVQWLPESALPITPGIRRAGAATTSEAIFLIGGRTSESDFHRGVLVGTPTAKEVKNASTANP
jgi:hypothetical protein